MGKTILFNEKNRGFTQFFQFYPNSVSPWVKLGQNSGANPVDNGIMATRRSHRFDNIFQISNNFQNNFEINGYQ